MSKFFLLPIILIVSCLHQVDSHGRMNMPPARNVMWRYGFNVPANYDDFGLNCGGVGEQHQKNGGKCGICGDSYSGPKDHELGGKYATGIVGQTYEMGQIIDVNILLSANHIGYFEFKLCPVTNENEEAKQECFDQHLLSVNGNNLKYNVRMGEKSIDLKVKLPQGITCTHCILQWRYRAGNNWGQENGQSGLGMGAQEEFWNCADIAITDNKNPFRPPNTPFVPVVTKNPVPKPEALTVDPGFEQITSPIYMSTQPAKDDNGQIACALHGVEPNLNILYLKIKVCLDNCKKDITSSCPDECFCVWTIDPIAGHT